MQEEQSINSVVSDEGDSQQNQPRHVYRDIIQMENPVNMQAKITLSFDCECCMG